MSFVGGRPAWRPMGGRRAAGVADRERVGNSSTALFICAGAFRRKNSIWKVVDGLADGRPTGFTIGRRCARYRVDTVECDRYQEVKQLG